MSSPNAGTEKKRMSKGKKVILWIAGSVVGVFVLLAILGNILNKVDPEGMAAIRAEQEASQKAKDTETEDNSSEAPTPQASTPATSKAPTTDPTEALNAKLKAAAGEAKISATLEDGRVSVETDLVDPRGDSGSPAAKQAIKICEAAAEFDGVTYVNVQEKDGTSWILYGHPAVPDGECSEI